MRPQRSRLDQLVVDRGLAPSRAAARGLILAGLVMVDGVVTDKCGTAVAVDSKLTVKQRPRYVSAPGDTGTRVAGASCCGNREDRS